MSSFPTLIPKSCAQAPHGQTWQDFVNFGLTGAGEIAHFRRVLKRNSTLFSHLLRCRGRTCSGHPDQVGTIRASLVEMAGSLVAKTALRAFCPAMTSGEPVTHASHQPHFALLLGLAWLLAAVQLLAQNWSDTALTLADTDDAMRLAQLRDWLGGQG